MDAAPGGAVSAQDYRVNAEVRRLLVSRWVDVSQLQIGTTNGVVYLLGRLDTTMEDPAKRDEMRGRGSSDRTVSLVVALEKDLRRMRDVRDVVMKLDNAIKRGGRWRATDGTATERRYLCNPIAIVHKVRQNDTFDATAERDIDADDEVFP